MRYVALQYYIVSADSESSFFKITIIGVVVNASQPTEFLQTYLVNDETGTIKVYRWREDTKEEEWKLTECVLFLFAHKACV